MPGLVRAHAILESYPPLPLDARRRQVRVVDILPSLQQHGDICLKLRVVSLFDSPAYEALSYTWGSFSEGRKARVNDQYLMNITNNVYRAITCLRPRFKTRTFWIDALCINQNDLHERSHQVALMGEIYKSATCVNVWLGDPGPVPTVSLTLLRKLRKDSQGIYMRHGTDWVDLDTRMLGFVLRNGTFVIEQALLNSEPKWHDRVWVIQEVVLAPRAYLCIGRKRLPFPGYHSFDMATKVFRRLAMNEESVVHSLFDKLGEVAQLRQRYRQGLSSVTSPVDLFETAYLTISAMAADPKDKVYSVLGMLSNPIAAFIGSDYRISCAEVYARATFATLKGRNGLLTLAVVTLDKHKRPTDGLPSWAVEYAPADKHNSNSEQTSFLKHEKSLDRYGALEDITSPASVRDAADSNFELVGGSLIRVRGLADIVADVDAFERNAPVSAWFPYWDRALAMTREALARYVADSTTMEIGVAAQDQARSTVLGLFDGLTFDEGNTDFAGPVVMAETLFDVWRRGIYASELSSCISSTSLTLLTEMTIYFRRYARYICAALALFSTASGLIGLATTKIAIGDRLAYVDGSVLSLVLRKEAGAEHYTFRGVAWVHCLWEETVRKRLNKKEDFIIR